MADVQMLAAPREAYERYPELGRFIDEARALILMSGRADYCGDVVSAS